MKTKPVQYSISIIAIVLVIIHILLPNLTVDLITVALLFIAIVPWLGALFKIVELPGGVKVEYQELEKVTDSAEKAGLINQQRTHPQKAKTPIHPEIASEDPNLALAGLRIELEKRLIKIAKSYNIKTHKTGVSALAKNLRDEKILTGPEYSVLSEMVIMLNSAVHGAKVAGDAVKWTLDTGNQILHSLDEKIAQESK